MNRLSLADHFSTSPLREDQALQSKEELKVRKNWGFLKKHLVVGHVIDPLIECDVISPDGWLSLKRKRMSEPERTEEFLWHLLKLDPGWYGVFLSALNSRGYEKVANKLEGLPQTRSRSDVSHGSSHLSRSLGRPAILTRHIPDSFTESPRVISSLSDGASASGQSEGGETVRVKQELAVLNEEIKTELRQLRVDLNSDRYQNRIDKLEKEFAALREEKVYLTKQLTETTEGASELKTRMKQMEKDYELLQENNKDLQNQLEQILEEAGNKDSKNKALVKQLAEKEAKLKETQTLYKNMMKEQTEKSEKLTNLNKEKLQLTQDVLAANKEKKALRERNQELEMSIRTQKEKLDREIKDIFSKLEMYRTLLEKKQKEKSELEKRLEHTRGLKDELGSKTKELTGRVQKLLEENEALKARIRQFEIHNHVVPPFVVRNTGSRRGSGYRS